MDKEQQKNLLIELMDLDEKDGLYETKNTAQLTLQEIRQLAERQWEGCHGCDETDKQMWINGFVTGYLFSKSE